MEKATIYISGIIGKDTTLLDVIRQYKSYKAPTEVEVRIDSVGGCVDTGQSIFSYLRKLDLPITTVATKAYSISASIFMAGDTRIVEEGENRVMIHFPFASTTGRAAQLKNVVKELETLERDFTKFYGNYTNVDEATIKALLDNETFLSANEALDLGLATEITTPLKATAFYNPKQENSMTKGNKLIQAMKDFVGVETQTQIKAILIQDSSGVELDFYELEDGIVPKIEDKARDGEGNDLEGEFVMPKGETYVFEKGVLTEIKEPVLETETEEEAPEEDIDIDALLKSLEENLFAKFSALKEAHNTKIIALETELKEVKNLIGSKSTQITAQENPKLTNKKMTLAEAIRA